MMQTFTPPSTISLSTEEFLYGRDRTPGIVAVEPAGSQGVRIFRREGTGTMAEEAAFRPWLLSERANVWRDTQITELAGNHAYRYLVEFADWRSFQDAVRAAQDAGERFFRLRSPIEQYLVQSGQTLFKEMTFTDLRRLQIDIETLGFNAHEPESKVIVVAMRLGNDVEELHVLDGDEGELLERVTARILRGADGILEAAPVRELDEIAIGVIAGKFGDLGITPDVGPLRKEPGSERGLLDDGLCVAAPEDAHALGASRLHGHDTGRTVPTVEEFFGRERDGGRRGERLHHLGSVYCAAPRGFARRRRQTGPVTPVRGLPKLQPHARKQRMPSVPRMPTLAGTGVWHCCICYVARGWMHRRLKWMTAHTREAGTFGCAQGDTWGGADSGPGGHDVVPAGGLASEHACRAGHSTGQANRSPRLYDLRGGHRLPEHAA